MSKEDCNRSVFALNLAFADGSDVVGDHAFQYTNTADIELQPNAASPDAVQDDFDSDIYELLLISTEPCDTSQDLGDYRDDKTVTSNS